jgi:hypothetical protein
MIMKTSEQDDAPRVRFDRPLQVKVMAVDRTWCRDSLVIDISDTGAEIEVAGYAAELTEFFLLLTSFGNRVFRRCKREWVHGARVGVRFNKTNIGMKSLEVDRKEAELAV